MQTMEMFRIMFEQGLTTSMRSWSELWLSRAHNFCCLNKNRLMPAEALIHLRRKLIEAGQCGLADWTLAALLGEKHPGMKPYRSPDLTQQAAR